MIAMAVMAFLTAGLDLSGQAALGAGETPRSGASLMSYEQSVRCAGLTQAASELEGGETAEGRKLFDAALYWSLATMQAAQISGRAADAAEDAQTRARILGVRQLSAGQAEARAALQRCRSRTPSLG